MNKLKALIIHGYSDSNKGDLAIVVGMVIGLRSIQPDCEICLQSVYAKADPDFDYHHRFVRRLGVRTEQMAIPSPYVDAKSQSVLRHGRAAINLASATIAEYLVRHIPAIGSIFKHQRQAINSIKEADVVLLKGGQYIYNDQGGVRAYLYLWRILHPIYVAHSLKRPVLMLGQSVGPLVNSRGRSMVTDSLALCKKLIVREQKSFTLLSELGLARKTAVLPDFAFLIEPKRPTEFANTAAAIESKRWLGLTVVNWYFPESDRPLERRASYVTALVDVAKNVYESTGIGVALFPQVTVQHHGESDVDLLKVVAERLRLAGVPNLLVSDDLAPEELSYLYGACVALLGTRLHSCILAACACTPIVAIRYQGFKTQGVMAELGLSDSVFDISEMDVQGITDAVLGAINNRDEISVDIGLRVSYFRRSILEALAEILPRQRECV